MLLYTQNGNLIVHMTMKYLTELLPNNQFARVHRSYIISLRYMNAIGKNQIHVNEIEIPIGESYRQNLDKLKIACRS